MFIEDEKVISKADVLSFLKKHIKKAVVEDIYIVNCKEFLDDNEKIAKEIMEFYKGDTIVVRSSSANEDCMETSNAGHFDSVLNVDSASEEAICEAVKYVLNSYMDEGIVYEGFYDEQVLVQRQTKNVAYSGVLFTRDLLKNRPYFMINYDDDGSTDSVTSGKAGKVLYVAHNVSVEELGRPFDKLIDAVREIMSLCSIDNLDIEFGIKKDGGVVIFQTRPLAAVVGLDRIAPDSEILKAKDKAKEEYGRLNHTLSDMAFWNPSEIIGDNPYPLDYSLYREIITSHIWSAGISAIGYHYINDELMYKLGNKPYISVDYSFEGLIPELLSPALRKKLKNYYEKRLKKDVTAHDKIEFEIVFSVFDFCTEENMDILLDYGFTKNEINEIHKALFFVTNMAIEEYSDIYAEDMTSLHNMQNIRHEIRDKNPLNEENVEVILGYISELLYSIKSDGTPQFSRQARLAFMARSFCKTLVKKGYIKSDEMDAFMLSINTVASDFERDFDAYSHGLISREEFNKQYGHLRLGTYNIRTDCYAKMYFDVGSSNLTGNDKVRPEAKTLDMECVSKALEDYEMSIPANEFVDFIKKTTENREYFKFEFTKSLSLILELIIHIGELYDIPRNDLSYLSIMDLFNSGSKEDLKKIISDNKALHNINSGLILPEVIFSKRDIDVIVVEESRPNFITANTVEGEVVILDENNKNPDIEGKIVVITKADPGYDWIFTKNIAGFITRYGGAASHMAIRCAEFDVPAAIGCGEKIFQDVCQMKKIRLDCGHKKISKVKSV